MGNRHGPLLWVILTILFRIVTKREFIICALLISSFLIYFQTNLIVDWADTKNWDFNRRRLPDEYYRSNHNRPYSWLNCDSMLSGHGGGIYDYNQKGRVVVQDPPDLPMDCDSLKSRILSNQREPNVRHRYAVSRVVYKDYFWLETVFSQTYSEHNSYCFAIDSKSSDKFANKIKQLGKCFPNVMVAESRYNYDSSGHYINFGHFECSELMLRNGGWDYIIWLQNHDLVLRTNAEVSRIIQFLNGSHSIGHKQAQWKRYAVFGDWSAKGLKLWKDESSRSKKQKNAVLQISQNYNEVFISRKLMEFVVNEMNYRKLLEAFEQPYRFATDELFWATLIATDDLELPGGPSKPCPDNRYYITRYNEWEKWYNPPCKSYFSRHGTCIFGMEYFNLFSNLYQIAANKIMPDFDYGFVKCFGELLHNRTYLDAESPTSMEIYSMGDSRVFC